MHQMYPLGTIVCVVSPIADEPGQYIPRSTIALSYAQVLRVRHLDTDHLENMLHSGIAVVYLPIDETPKEQ